MSHRIVTVLIVDDVASFRRVAAEVVEASDGFSVAGEADSGEHAVDFVAGNDVDLVLMDVHMPGGGGFAAAQQISDRFPSVMVVLLSVRDEQDLPRKPGSVGAQFCRKARFGPAELEGLWHSFGRQN